jgi:molecular chaperone DnaK (HSP70)
MPADEATSAIPGERHAIGISFGNSNSSIALAQIEDKPEVIANEDGGQYQYRHIFILELANHP